jgi:hypothetical protein
MKTLSLLAAAALFSSVAAANATEPVALTETQLDNVTAGQAMATLEITNLSASGPASATASATGVTVTAATVGGLAPSNTATVNASLPISAPNKTPSN